MIFCRNRTTRFPTALGFFLSLAFLVPLQAAEQVIQLSAGWNAVYLELQPDESDPAVVFDDPAIEKVTMWLPTKARVDSLTAADAVASKPSSWRVWQPASSPAAFLNDLFEVQARSAFLIKATEATTLTLTGDPFFERKKWLAPSFNLTGFDVDPAAPPTFARYFDGSRAHKELKIYKMVAGQWVKVSPGETIRRGHAYWVWTKEGSDFQGPIGFSGLSTGQGRLRISNIGFPLDLNIQKTGSIPVLLSAELSSNQPFTIEFDEATPVSISSFSRLLDDSGKYSFTLDPESDELLQSGRFELSFRGAGVLLHLPIEIVAE